jgi:hypothetical protein
MCPNQSIFAKKYVYFRFQERVFLTRFIGRSCLFRCGRQSNFQKFENLIKSMFSLRSEKVVWELNDGIHPQKPQK